MCPAVGPVRYGISASFVHSNLFPAIFRRLASLMSAVRLRHPSTPHCVGRHHGPATIRTSSGWRSTICGEPR